MAAWWDPDSLLRITGTAKSGAIQCSGINTSSGRRGTRCGFQKYQANADNVAIKAMLPSLARKPLSQVSAQDLDALAELCLCRDWHGCQRHALVRRWKEKIDGQIAVEAKAPPLRPATPESRTNSTRPITSFGLLTPPSSQNNSQSSSFSMPVDPESQNAAREPVTNIQQDRDLLHLENRMLKAAERQLNSLLKEESAARGQAEEKLRDAQKQISHLLSEKELLDIRLKAEELDTVRAEEKLGRAEQRNSLLASEKERLDSALRAEAAAKSQLQEELKGVELRLSELISERETFGYVKDGEIEQLHERLATQRKELTDKKSRELQAAHTLYSAEVERVKERSATELEVATNAYKALLEKTEKARDAKIHALEDRLAAADAERDNLKPRIQALEEQLASAQSEHDRLQREMESKLASAMEQHESSAQETARAVQDIEDKRDQALAELQCASADNGKLAAENENLKEQLRRNQISLAAENENLKEQLRRTQNSLAAENENLKEQLRRTQNSLAAENENLKEQLRRTQNALAAATQQVADLERECQAERAKSIRPSEVDKRRGRRWLRRLEQWLKERQATHTRTQSQV